MFNTPIPEDEDNQEVEVIPIENELAYILRLDFSEASLTGWERSEILQAYPLPKIEFPRIREEFFAETGHIEWTENTKTPAHLCGEDFEKEQYTTKEVFNIWWLMTPQNERLRKTRYSKNFGDEKWCVDFFRNKAGQTYLVKAEVEMPSGRKHHITRPTIIYANSIYAVPRGDTSFSSRKMANESKADAALNPLIDNPKIETVKKAFKF